MEWSLWYLYASYIIGTLIIVLFSFLQYKFSKYSTQYFSWNSFLRILIYFIFSVSLTVFFSFSICFLFPYLFGFFKETIIDSIFRILLTVGVVGHIAILFSILNFISLPITHLMTVYRTKHKKS